MATLITRIAVLVLTFIGTTRANTFDRWNDDSYKQGLIDVREADCTNSACLSMFPDKRGFKLEETDDKSWPVTRRDESYPVTGGLWQFLCPCETQQYIIDLGVDHYPRYLATARCASKTCRSQFNQCRLIHYKVHILRKRDASIGNEASEEQPYVEQIVLPESLRKKWQMKPMKIPVGCVAGEARE